MPYTPSAGAKFNCDEACRGYPLLFVHDLAGDHRNWEAQPRFFARRFRCIAHNARGYQPFDEPKHLKRKSSGADDGE